MESQTQTHVALGSRFRSLHAYLRVKRTLRLSPLLKLLR
uniref:Uncharacterized protein n=1 Tax=Brassica campestris TaxID=3711 RepID=A0A3P5ZYR0_BRACM|nr:unnamed protein product [Brassica rapa]